MYIAIQRAEYTGIISAKQTLGKVKINRFDYSLF